MQIFVLSISVCRTESTDDPYEFSDIYLSMFDGEKIQKCMNDFVFLGSKNVIMNSTSSKTITCRKKMDDYRPLEISTDPNVSSKEVAFSLNQQSNTLMEITIYGFGYIGAFQLTCSSAGDQNNGARADILIGGKYDICYFPRSSILNRVAEPGQLKQIDSCVVYENRYIDCTIESATMVSAIRNWYPYTFEFFEIHSVPSMKDVYYQSTEPIRVDDRNKTITFRWFPVDEGNFPSGLRMVIMGTLRDFGTANLTIDMTPSREKILPIVNRSFHFV